MRALSKRLIAKLLNRLKTTAIWTLIFIDRHNNSLLAFNISIAELSTLVSVFNRKIGHRNSLSPQRTQRTQRIGHFIGNYGVFSVSYAYSVVKNFTNYPSGLPKTLLLPNRKSLFRPVSINIEVLRRNEWAMANP